MTAPGTTTTNGAATREMTYLEAISDALREEMRRDDAVICIGEDIGAFGGAFKVTDGFAEEFGAERVIDAPLAESAIIGAAVGAAAEGLRPVCEMQFADFISCGFDQLVNVAAKLHYRQGIAVPMVVRLPSGGGFSGGPFHRRTPRPGSFRRRGSGWSLRRPPPTPSACSRARSAIRTRCAFSSTRGSTDTCGGGPRRRASRSAGQARVAREATEVTWSPRARAAGSRFGRRRAERTSRSSTRSLCRWTRDDVRERAPDGKVLIAHEATRTAGSGRRSPRASRRRLRRPRGPCAASRRPTCRSRSARRSSRRSCRSSTT